MADYIDNLGNQDIFDMSLKQAIYECNERITILEDQHLLIQPGTDPSKEQDQLLEWMYNAPYVVHQFMYSAATSVRAEHGSVILIELDTLEKFVIPIHFNRAKHFPSFAHEYLRKLRRMCAENDIRTMSEMQYVAETQFYGLNY